MRVELRSVLHDDLMSDCGNCYQAEVYLNNKPFAHLQNDGTGEETDIKPHHLFQGTGRQWQYWREAINKHLYVESEDAVLDSSYGWEDTLLSWADGVLKKQHPWVAASTSSMEQRDFKLFMLK
jgi:hypothetical protein